MAVEENEAIVRRLMEAQERGDMEEWVGLWAPDARNHGRPVAPDRLRLLFTSLRTAFPDRHHEFMRVIAQGDQVVTYLTNSGTFGDIPQMNVEHVHFLASAPTGAPYSVQSIHIWHLVDGKIAEHWAVRDDLTLLTELGVIAPPPRTE